MAVPVVSFIVNRLGVLLIEEAKFLYGVSDQVEQIRLELKRMQCFLQDADYEIQSDHHVDVKVNNWLAEIRKLAYETEDILETYVIQVSSKRNKKDFQNTLKRSACIFNECIDVHRVGSEIGVIKNKITDLTTRLHTYGLKSTGQRSSAVEEQHELRQSYHHVKEDFVGFEEDLNKVVKHLVQVDDYTPRRVVSICGMGGLGKTTLAKNVYHHKDVRSHFDGFAWVCISQQYKRRDILRELFNNLVPKTNKDVVWMTDNQLFEQLYEVQQRKKCLVVLDDIWSIQAWKKLKVVYQNVRSHKWNDDLIQHENVISNVLALSYHDLPYQLKPCFLSFGHFPEDYKIDAERLYHSWIGDGIIVDNDKVGDETIMDVAKRYLGALAQRCMVQVEVEEYTERIKYCRIHDLMLQLCLSKAEMNDFLGTIHLQRKTDLTNCFSTTTSTTTAPQIRKLAIHLKWDVERVVLPELETTKHLRSIFCNSRSVVFHSRRVYGMPSTELNSHLKYFKLLRNLDLEGLKFDEKSVKSIGKLISLRYLRFGGCLIPKWHSSICKLKHLQTLDLQYCEFNSGEVIVIHGMEQLRHLYIPLHFDVKFKLDGLSNLETLGGFNTGSCAVNDLCKLSKLRQLEDATFWKKHNQDLAAFIKYLSSDAKDLRQTSLSVDFCGK